MTATALIPLETRTVMFNQDELIVTLAEAEGRQLIYVPLNTLVEHLGLDTRSQRRRVNDDAVLSEVTKMVRIERPAGKGGGSQDMLCLPLNYINGFLFGISAKRVKESLRDKVIQYQRDCYDVLAEAFGVGETGLRSTPDETGLSPRAASLAQIRDISLAVAQMAHEMMLHEEQLTDHEGRLETVETRLTDAAKYIGGMERRLKVVEEKTSPRTIVSEDEADEIRAKVVDLATLIAEKQAAEGADKKRSPYQTVYHTVYTHFSVSSYKRIRKADYDQVLEFLDGWKNRLQVDEGSE